MTRNADVQARWQQRSNTGYDDSCSGYLAHPPGVERGLRVFHRAPGVVQEGALHQRRANRDARRHGTAHPSAPVTAAPLVVQDQDAAPSIQVAAARFAPASLPLRRPTGRATANCLCWPRSLALRRYAARA